MVSGYELQRCLIAGADPKKIIFSGVGKTEKEISLALQNKIFSINIESESELERIIKVSEDLEIKADCFIRLNPEISSESHPYIQTALKSSKFGVDTDTAIRIAKLIKESKQVNLIGIASHIGSQISTGSTMSSPQSSQSLPIGGSSFHATDLHQATQSNQLAAGHLPRANYQQQGRVS